MVSLVERTQNDGGKPSGGEVILTDIKDFESKHREGIRYIIFGICTCAIGWVSYAVFVWLGIDLNISNILSWASGLLFAFVTNKLWVFNSRSKKLRIVLKELTYFTGARLATGILSFVLFPILLAAGLDQTMFGTDGMVARITVTAIEIVLNYIISKKLIFAHKKN